MTSVVAAKDLVLLVADQNMKAATEGLLSRRESLAIRELTFDLYVHPDRDPGCLRKSAEFLKPFHTTHHHALIMFDRHGCGQEQQAAAELQRRVETALMQSGWQKRAAAVVLDPELEAWVWSDSPEVDEVLGWGHGGGALHSWLVSRGYWERGRPKPAKPKDAMEQALREVRRPRSSAYFRELARRVGLQRCRDQSFQRFRRLMREWFPANER